MDSINTHSQIQQMENYVLKPAYKFNKFNPGEVKNNPFTREVLAIFRERE